MKSFYNDYLRLIEEGEKVDSAVEAFLRPLYAKYIAEGYNVRELTSIICSSATIQEAETVIMFATEKRRVEQKCTICNKHGHTRLHCPDQMKIGETE